MDFVSEPLDGQTADEHTENPTNNTTTPAPINGFDAHGMLEEPLPAEPAQAPAETEAESDMRITIEHLQYRALNARISYYEDGTLIPMSSWLSRLAFRGVAGVYNTYFGDQEPHNAFEAPEEIVSMHRWLDLQDCPRVDAVRSPHVGRAALREIRVRSPNVRVPGSRVQTAAQMRPQTVRVSLADARQSQQLLQQQRQPRNQSPGEVLISHLPLATDNGMVGNLRRSIRADPENITLEQVKKVRAITRRQENVNPRTGNYEPMVPVRPLRM